jgi:hypothetical protein
MKYTPLLLTALLSYGFLSPLHADEFRVLDLGSATQGIDHPWIRVIGDQNDWQEVYYHQIHDCPYADFLVPIDENDPCNQAAPEVDFETSQVVVGGLGVKPSTAHQLLVSQVDSSGQQHRITVLDYEGCVGLTVLHYPIAALVIEKTEKPIQVQVEQASALCE